MNALNDLHKAVRDLIEPQRIKLIRDGGTKHWTTVPSLWKQLTDATGTGSEPMRGSSRWRTPIDLDILELRQEIIDVVHDALTSYDLIPRSNLPESLRLLAATIVGTADIDLAAWWTWRVQSWIRRTTYALGLNEEPQPRRIRDTACPTCQATHVTVILDGERQRVPALVIDFVGHFIRAAECSACGATWFRGESLYDLADAIFAGQ